MKKPEKLPKDIVDLLLKRLNDEFTAYYFYRSASNWCKGAGFFKAGSYFAKESEDELSHAKGIEDFLVDWNVTPELPTIAKPEVNFTGIGSIIEKAYKLEYDLYEEYEDTSVKILKLGDVCSFDFLQKYRGIQTASVAEYSDMINVLDGVDEKDKFKILLLEETLFGE
jgi:ferritin